MPRRALLAVFLYSRNPLRDTAGRKGNTGEKLLVQFSFGILQSKPVFPRSFCCFICKENDDPGAAAAAIKRMPELHFTFPAPRRPDPSNQTSAGRAERRGERGLAEILRGTVCTRPVRQGATGKGAPVEAQGIWAPWRREETAGGRGAHVGGVAQVPAVGLICLGAGRSAAERT